MPPQSTQKRRSQVCDVLLLVKVSFTNDLIGGFIMPGRVPSKNSRRNQNAKARAGWVQLPAEGAKVKAPAWPLEGRAPRGWAVLWKKPQAVMWRELGNEDVVARYLVLKNLIQQPESLEDVNAAALSELRQMEDRLGLSPMALKRLQWEIVAGGEVKPDLRIVESRERFARL